MKFLREKKNFFSLRDNAKSFDKVLPHVKAARLVTGHGGRRPRVGPLRFFYGARRFFAVTFKFMVKSKHPTCLVT